MTEPADAAAVGRERPGCRAVGQPPVEGIRRPPRLRRRLVRGRARRGLRLPGTQRRRQDDDGPDARHAHRADSGFRYGGRDPAGARERGRDPSPHRGHARIARPLPSAERHREPRVLRRAVRGSEREPIESGAPSRRSTSPTGRTTRAVHCPRAFASASPSRGRCSATRRSSSSTNRPRGWTRSPRAVSTS